jgi:anti-sigma factor ChrR (cupin superfamily)
MPQENSDWVEMDLNKPETNLDKTAPHVAGALGDDELQAFERWLKSDAALAADWKTLDAALADAAMGSPEAAPSPNVREKLLAQIAVTPQEPRAVAAAYSSRLAEGEWKTLAPHVTAKVLYRDQQTGLATTLIKLAPGGHLPRHRHLDVEQTLVVEGDCRVNGETFYPGDFRWRPAVTEDSEVTTEFGTTILLIAPDCIESLEPDWPSLSAL